MASRLDFMLFAQDVRQKYKALAEKLEIPTAGYIHYRNEAPALYDLADAAPGPVLEVGTYFGLSTCFLAAPGKQLVVTVDPHEKDLRDETLRAEVGEIDTAKHAKEAWKELGIDDRIQMVKQTSASAAELTTLPDEFGLVFIDGDHRPGPCALDISLWAPRVMVGGYLALHDWGVAGQDAEKWDVAGCARSYIEQSGQEWFGPVLCGTVAWFRREA